MIVKMTKELQSLVLQLCDNLVTYGQDWLQSFYQRDWIISQPLS